MINKFEISTILDSIMNACSCGIITLENNGKTSRIININDAQAEMFGYSVDEYMELFANNPYESIHPDDFVNLCKNVDSVIDSPTLSKMSTEYRHKCKNGDWKWVVNNSEIVMRENGIYIGTTITVDINKERDIIKSLTNLTEKTEFLQKIFIIYSNLPLVASNTTL